MTTPVLTFFNNKGGVGKTSLVFHLAWMFAKLGKRVLAVDLDPQCNLTSLFLNDENIEALLAKEDKQWSLYHCISPLTRTGDLLEPHPIALTTNLKLLPGDIRISNLEEIFSEEWPKALSDRNLYRPFRILSCFWSLIHQAAADSDLVLVDIGPNLGAINRSVLLASDFLVIPIGADVFSLQGLKNLGPTIRSWRNAWSKRRENWASGNEADKHNLPVLPQGALQAIGYLCQQHGTRLNRPVKAYDRWINQAPAVYSETILEKTPNPTIIPSNDPNCLGTIKHYRSLVPLAQECQKPVFELRPADGAIGAHARAAQEAQNDFQVLARKIAERINVSM
jgi:chromosome partitioning protein